MRLLIASLMLIIASPVYAQTMGSTSGATSSVDINSPATTTNHLITTPTVAAPGLTAAGVETCLGSASGGVSVMGGGFTFGSTKVDEGCTIRLLARQLFAFGFQKAAVALMCQDERVAVAMDAAGSPCPPQPVQIAATAEIDAPPPIDPLGKIAKPTEGDAPLNLLAFSNLPAERHEPGQKRVRLSLLPASPMSPEEQAWFDRASIVN